MKFSSRYQASQGDTEVIYNDIPRKTRIGFQKSVLDGFVRTTKKHDPENFRLHCHEIHKQFCALIRDENDPSDYDPESSWNALTSHLKSCSWLEFFDFVEMVGNNLLEWDRNPFVSEPEYRFKDYQTKLNSLLEEDNIGWRINENSEIVRHIPKSIEESLTLSEKDLTDNFESARFHYKKSKKYLFNPPLDPANSIKEMVSAMESVGKKIYPSCSTLGDVLKIIKKNENHPSLLISAYEKLYAYANDTPTVRHGHILHREVTLNEAELFFLSGVAFIRYLIMTHKHG